MPASGFLISCARPAASWPREASWSTWARRVTSCDSCSRWCRRVSLRLRCTSAVTGSRGSASGLPSAPAAPPAPAAARSSRKRSPARATVRWTAVVTRPRANTQPPSRNAMRPRSRSSISDERGGEVDAHRGGAQRGTRIVAGEAAWGRGDADNAADPVPASGRFDPGLRLPLADEEALHLRGVPGVPRALGAQRSPVGAVEAQPDPPLRREQVRQDVRGLADPLERYAVHRLVELKTRRRGAGLGRGTLDQSEHRHIEHAERDQMDPEHGPEPCTRRLLPPPPVGPGAPWSSSRGSGIHRGHSRGGGLPPSRAWREGSPLSNGVEETSARGRTPLAW